MLRISPLENSQAVTYLFIWASIAKLYWPLRDQFDKKIIPPKTASF